MKKQNLKNLIGMCLNWKGLLAVAAIGALLFFFVSPQQAIAYLPFLLVAVCPLSMIFGMRMMGKNGATPDNKPTESTGPYTCPMHPNVLKRESGKCPQCGMNLIPK